MWSLLYVLCACTTLYAQKDVAYYKAQIKKHPDSITLLQGLAHAFVQSRADSTLFYIDQAIERGQLQNDSVSLAHSYYTKAIALDKKGAILESKEYFLRSMAISNAMGMAKKYTYALNSIGNLFSTMGQNDSALYYYERCLSGLKTFDSTGVSATVYYNMGELYQATGNYTQSLTHFLKSLEIREKFKDPYRISLCLDAIGMLYLLQKKHPQAIQYFHQALKKIDTASYAIHTEHVYSNLGDAFLQTHRTDSAEYYINKSIQVAYAIDDTEGVAYINLLLSDLSLKKEKYRQALSHAEHAVEYYTHSPYQEMAMQALLKKAQVLQKIDRFVAAKAIALSALKEYSTIGAKETYKALHQLLAQVNESLKLYQQALHHERVYRIYEDSLYNVPLASELSELKGKYETEKKARELAQITYERNQQSEKLAQSKNQILGLIAGAGLLLATALAIFKLYQRQSSISKELEDKNEIIESALVERELLLKEIHHRVKNNLQIVSSLLSIESESYNSTKDLVHKCQDRIQAMAMIHENLYQSEDISTLDTKNYIEKLIREYKRSHQESSSKVVFNTQISPTILSLDKLIAMGLIINECVTNSIKHAFPNQEYREINICLTSTLDTIDLKIEDNGIGFSHNPPAHGIGIKLIRGLTHQLNGKLMTSGTGQGAQFHISIPH